MAKENYKIGSTVQLISGGPLLTITEIPYEANGKTTIECVWFSKKGVLHFGSIDTRLLNMICEAK